MQKKNYILLVFILTCSRMLVATGPTEPHFTVWYQHEQSQDPEVAILYAHGLGATQWQGKRLFAKMYTKDAYQNPVFNTCWLYEQPMVLFDFPDAKSDKMEFHRHFVNLAGPLDIERLALAHATTRATLPHTHLIGSGVSRGAASWLVFAAQRHPENVAAIIVESPFDTLDSVITHMLKRFAAQWLPYGTVLGRYVMQLLFPAIDFTAPTPLDVVDQLPLDLPILLIHSQEDRVVPVHSSRMLYAKLLATGHTNAHYLELEHGWHGKLIWGPDKEMYQQCVHAFLHNYNLPHCAELAQKGQAILQQTQPTKEDLLKRYTCLGQAS